MGTDAVRAELGRMPGSFGARKYVDSEVAINVSCSTSSLMLLSDCSSPPYAS